jgi:hypothetical protein
LVGVGLAVFVALGEGVAALVFVALGDGLADVALVGLGDALADLALLGLGVALFVALALADAVLLAEALGVTEAESRNTTVWPAGTERAAEVAAGGAPQTLDAPTLTPPGPEPLPTWLAAAGVLPSRPATMLEEMTAAPATAPRAEDLARADFTAAP